MVIFLNLLFMFFTKTHQANKFNFIKTDQIIFKSLKKKYLKNSLNCYENVNFNKQTLHLYKI